MTALTIIVLIIYTALNNFYLYQLVWGGWNNASVKGFFYLFTSVFILFLIVAEMVEYKSNSEYQVNIIGKLSLLANFIIFALTQLNIMPKPIEYFYLLNGSILAISIIIIISGLRHGTFKN